MNPAREYEDAVLDLVAGGLGQQDEKRFNELALKGFELQYLSDSSYREYCARRNISPANIADWRQIVPVASFPLRKVLSAAFPARAEELSLSCGVAELRRKRGPFFPSAPLLRLLDAANNALEKVCVFPDIDRMEMLFMAPVPLMAPGMVMASGLERIRKRFGTGRSRFLISFGGLDLKGLISALKDAESSGRPLAVLGATWGFDYFFDACSSADVRFRLPGGSRIIESGGYVGRYTKCSIEDFFGKCGDVLGIPGDHCINALWLCENSSVYYDNVLKNALSGVRKGRCKELPPWARTIAVDPRDFRPLPPGETGLLRHYDLTNRGMAIAVQTGNIGLEKEGGFEVLGKWNRKMEGPEIEKLPRHPGGKIVSAVMDSFLERKFSKIGRIYFS